jgi:LuxR family maltose regulon positive regulatory protein
LSELLKTKLYIPRPRANLVRRLRLTERLKHGVDRKLTLIAAPAGFGKTTLLSEWIPHSPRCVTWFALDQGDNDPLQFWKYFIAALQTLSPGIGENALALLKSPQLPDIKTVLTSLINSIADFPDVFAQVLDDYHWIANPTIDQALIFLIDHQPPNMHLVISSRIDPGLRLERLRVRGELNELRIADLRFTFEETAEFLKQVMTLDLSPGQITALEQRTEGWIAGLQIAALSMQGHDDIQEFVRVFSGSHRHVLGYLIEEVISQRPKGTLNFLLQTSILDRLCGPLCNAVTGDSDGQVKLEMLELANLFVTPLDDEGVWYRYHHLFAEVLQLQLQQTQRDQVPKLHRRAGNWYARQGMIAEAVRHAMLGADYEEAARWIESVAGNMLRQGASASLTVWLDAMPEETIRAHPRLCLTRGWIYFMGSAFNLESAAEWAQLALRVAEANGSLDSGLTGEVTALQAMIAATRGEVARSLELSRQALDDLPLDSPWRSAIVFCLGTAYYLSGEMVAAAPVLEEALQLSQAASEHYVQLAAASFLGEIRVFQGDLDHAMEMYEQVLAWADPNLPQKGGIMAYGGLAYIQSERDQLDAALGYVQSGIKQLDQVGGAWSAFVLYRVLARVCYAQGKWTDAFEALDRAYQIGERAQISLVMTQAAALRACLHLALGDLASAENWAKNNGLNPDDADASHPGWREVEYLALARVLNAQGRRSEALSLLERLMQSAEAEERTGSAIEILTLKSLVIQGLGNTALALECLERALTLAEPEGYVRTFVDEGEPIRLFIKDLRLAITKRSSDNSRLLAYIDGLLSAFAGASHDSTPDLISDQRPNISDLVDPLSNRELEVLRLIDAGLKNQEIAVRLVIAISTVKTHINNIYGKFGVHSRTQAVAIARELGLLPN